MIESKLEQKIKKISRLVLEKNNKKLEELNRDILKEAKIIQEHWAKVVLGIDNLDSLSAGFFTYEITYSTFFNPSFKKKDGINFLEREFNTIKLNKEDRLLYISKNFNTSSFFFSELLDYPNKEAYNKRVKELSDLFDEILEEFFVLVDEYIVDGRVDEKIN